MDLPIITRLEESFDSNLQQDWFLRSWWISVVCSAIYFIGIFSGKFWMENRPKYNLRRALATWSAGLAVFSIAGALVTLRNFVQYVSAAGWHNSVCEASIFDSRVGFWVWLFALSKVPELGDTVFIVLRKQKLMFLHWYHHITVLIYTWYSYRDHIAPARYFITANYTVHAVMYSYYALRASGMVNIPRQVNVTITLMQLIQMVIGCVVNIYALLQLQAGLSCDTNMNNITWSLVMYFSYFVLFAQFFYSSYVSPPKRLKDSNADGIKVVNGMNGHTSTTKKES